VQGFCNEQLACFWSIGVSRVDQIDTELDGTSQNLEGVAAIRRPAPKCPLRVIRIAPKPSRLTGRSPPNRKTKLVPASVTAGEFAAKIVFDPPATSVAPPPRVVPRNFRRVIEFRDRR